MILSNEVIESLKEGLNKCIENNEIPVCAIVLDKNDKLVSIGINNRQKARNVLGHAEINAILEAEKVIDDWRLDGYRMIVTLEPCLMCQSIIEECRLDKVYYLCHRDGVSTSSRYEYLSNKSLSEDYIKKLLTTFFNNRR